MLTNAVEARPRPARRTDLSLVPVVVKLEAIELSGIRLEPESNSLHVAGQTWILRAKPVSVLWLLMRCAGVPVTREELIRHCWGTYRPRHDAALRVYVHGLRRLIDSDPAVERRIVTVRAAGTHGYLFLT